MDTNSTLETILTLAAIGGLLAPVAYLMERTTWTWTRHDADARRIGNEIHALDGAAHR